MKNSLILITLILSSGSAYAGTITCTLNPGQPDNSPSKISITEFKLNQSITFQSEDANNKETPACEATYAKKPKATKWSEYDVSAESQCQEVTLKLQIADGAAPKQLQATYSDAGSMAYYTCK